MSAHDPAAQQAQASSTAPRPSQAVTTAPEILSPHAKKANHIQSEQKRRQAIRGGFDQLCELVPTLSPAQSKSEALVLGRVCAHLEALQAENAQLVRQIQALGGHVPPEEAEEMIQDGYAGVQEGDAAGHAHTPLRTKPEETQLTTH